MYLELIIIFINQNFISTTTKNRQQFKNIGHSWRPPRVMATT
jgi:hypothetical protein